MLSNLFENFAANYLVGRSLKYYGNNAGQYYIDPSASLLPSTSFDYESSVGEKYENSVVMACIAWTFRKLSESKIMLQKYDTVHNKWIKPNRSVTELEHIVECLNFPNEYYNSDVIWFGTLVSLACEGRSFLHKRLQKNKLVGFDYISHLNIKPSANQDNINGTKLITGYKYTPPGGTEEIIPYENIIMPRWGVDPKNIATGISPFRSVLREIAADNEAATTYAALSRNQFRSGPMFSQKVGPNVKPMNPEQRKELLKLAASFLKDKRGMPFVPPVPVDITNISWSPEQMQLGSQRNDLAARIASEWGLDIMVLGLPSENKTYSNFGEALDGALENCVLPILNMLGNQLSYFLIPYQYRGVFRIAWDTSEIRGLQEDKDKRHERIRQDWKAGIITLGTTCSLLEYPEPKAEDADKRFNDIFPRSGENTASATGGKEPTPSLNGKHNVSLPARL